MQNKTLIFSTLAGEIQALSNKDYEITEMRIYKGDVWHKAEILRSGTKQNGFYFVGIVNNSAVARIFLNASGEWKCQEIGWLDCPKHS